MYYVAMAINLYIGGLGPRYYAPDGIGFFEIAANALFLHAWFPTALNSLVTGGWSIGDEMMFYLLVPFLAAAVKIGRAHV